ncbi:LacI family DNA-binding transcriptional regulator [Ruania halotolerans]|uniref:LacI family DNA-binding transcriptional regulator n=1 Tax=Ruania halotolerans TaxID=2897773 RepID=UPI001E56B0AC|nr:LacI family DNA-binding transcriptional regulator [Ruania halotolerans]UFU06891.1 LacI family transcriptional regulator [Ruania halotolerans]
MNRRRTGGARVKATIYSIARELDISASTVSRAFSRPDMVNAKVRERILATAQAQGYELNRAARGLATGRTGLIGLVVLDITNPFFPPLVRAVERAASESDASVMLLDAESGGQKAADQLKRLSAQVDGLIVASPRLATKDLQAAVGSTPTVLVNRSVRGIPSVTCDNSAALREAGDHLVELGHRRILLLRGPAGSWAASQRTNAVRSWAQQTSADVELVELGPVEATYEAGWYAAEAIATSGATAIMAFDDYLACGVVGGLAEQGLSVPDDRSIIGCDDVLLARTLTPQLSTVTAPFEELGARAVTMLSEVSAGGAPGNQKLSGVYASRGTTGRV